jgi:hypothetical protein
MERKIHVADDLHAGIAIERFTVLENDLVRVNFVLDLIKILIPPDD